MIKSKKWLGLCPTYDIKMNISQNNKTDNGICISYNSGMILTCLKLWINKNLFHYGKKTLNFLHKSIKKYAMILINILAIEFIV